MVNPSTATDTTIKPRNAETILQCMNCFEFGHKAKNPKSGKNCAKPPAKIPAGLSSWQLDLAKKIRKEYNYKKKSDKERKEAARKKAEEEKAKQNAIQVDD